jgi:long-chain acyl-CoA synthetase
MTDLSYNLTESASMYPDHPAVRMDDQVLKYGPGRGRVQDGPAAVRQRPGARRPCRLMLPNVPQFVISYYGIPGRAGSSCR